MAQPKLTVTLEGRVIGTRRTDRKYTHVVALTAFDVAVFRKVCAEARKGYAKYRDRSDFDHAVAAASPTYRYADQYDDAARARFQAIADAGFEAYVAGRDAESVTNTEASIVRRLAEGAAVLSWHGSEVLAAKARNAAVPLHASYRLVVLPVDA